MGAANFTVANFLAGHWSQTAQGRIDKPEYPNALNVCVNSLPIEQGAWTRRPGFQTLAHTKGGKPARILSYDYEQQAPYMVEVGATYMRFFEAGALVTTQDNQTVTSISTANPAIITTAAAHGWSTGNTVMLSALGTTAAILQNRQFTITVLSSTTFSIADALTNTSINGALVTGYVASSGTVSRVLEVSTPFNSATYSSVRMVQTDNSAIFLQTNTPPQIIGTGPSFAISPVNFVDGPYLDPPTNGAQLIASGVSGSITVSIQFAAYSSTQAYITGDYVSYSGNSYVSLANNNVGNTPGSSPSYWQQTSAASSVNNGAGFSTIDVGRHIRLFSEPAQWVQGGNYSVGALVSYPDGQGGYSYWSCIIANTASLATAPGTSYYENVSGVQILVTAWSTAASVATWTWGKIGGLANLISIPAVTTGNFSNVNAVINGQYTQLSGSSASISGTQTVAGSYPGGYRADEADTIGWIGIDMGSAISVGGMYVSVPPDTGLMQATANYYSSDYASVYSLTAAPALRLVVSNTPLSDPTTQGTTVASYFPAPITSQAYNPSLIGYTEEVTLAIPGTTAYRYYYLVASAYNKVNGTYLYGMDCEVYVYISQLSFFSSGGSGDFSTASTVSVDILGPPLLYAGVPINTWRLGLFQNITAGYPACGTYHEGRLWLAGSVPNRFDASQPNQVWGQQVNFGPTDLDIGTVTDSSAIDYTLNSKTTNTILWMSSNQQGIIVGTERQEWLVQATTVNSPLTATNIQAHPVTSIGSSLAPTAEAVTCELTQVFIQRYGKRVMEYFADVFSGRFTSPNLAIDAQDLFPVPVDILARQQNLTPVLWARRTDGVLIGTSYKREALFSSQGPTFNGWHSHTLGSGKSVLSLCVGPTVDGSSDALTIVSGPTATQNFCLVETMAPFFQETDSISTAAFLDAAIVPTSQLTLQINGQYYLQLNGLWTLNGNTVTCWIGGLDCGDWLVTNGTVQVPYYGSGNTNTLFTQGFVDSFGPAAPALVGFTYTSQGQLVPPATPAETGGRKGPGLGMLRRLHRFAAKLVQTQGISFGTVFGKLHAAILKTYPGGTVVLPLNTLYTGIYRDTLNDDNSLDGALAWQISRPYPATVAAITGSGETNET